MLARRPGPPPTSERAISRRRRYQRRAGYHAGRSGRLILPTLILALGLLNVGVMLNVHEPDARTQRASAANVRWQSLTPEQRLECVQRYQALERRADGTAVLDAAREFARQSAAEQQRLRAVQRLMQDVLDRQAPTDRRELLRLTPRARAYFVYRALEAELPDWLAQLAELSANGRSPTQNALPSWPGQTTGADADPELQNP